MATRSGRYSTMIAPSRSKMVESRSAMGSRGDSLMAPQVRQINLLSRASSTTPKPVYSVPQSMPSTRISQSLAPYANHAVYWLAALGTAASYEFLLAQKRGVSRGAGTHAMTKQETGVGGFVEDLAQNVAQQRNKPRGRCRSQISQFAHPCSSAKRVATNGDSLTLAGTRPEITLTHNQADSTRISVTMKTST